MSRIPFKRHLIILGVCILAIGVIVPLTTFAQAPRGEQQHAPIKAQVSQHVDLSLGTITIKATTDALCGTASTTINSTPFIEGDVVIGEASVAPTDPSDTGEASEGETLVLLEQTSTLTKPIATIAIADGKVPIDFTALASSSLVACINGADQDEIGTITVTVIPPIRFDKLVDFLGSDSFHNILDTIISWHDVHECASDIITVISPLLTSIEIIIESRGTATGPLFVNPAPPGMAEACASAFPFIQDQIHKALERLKDLNHKHKK